MAFKFEQLIAESNTGIQSCAAAYSKAVAEKDVVAAYDALLGLSAITDAAIAVFVVVVGAVTGAKVEREEHTP